MLVFPDLYEWIAIGIAEIISQTIRSNYLEDAL
jgi:hypothetical protein